MSDAVPKESEQKPDETTTAPQEPAPAEAKPEAAETEDAKPASTAEASEVKDTPSKPEKKERENKPRPPRVRKEGETETAENEIMVAAKGQIKNYLGYAFRILNKTDHRSLKIRATGNAIVKALILIELVKRKVGEIYSYDLHQQNKIYSMEIVSFEESKVEGMEKIEVRRRVTAMDTILSKDMLDEADPGYQFCKPEPKEEGAAASSTPGANKKEGGGFGRNKGKKGRRTYNNFDDDDKDDKTDDKDGENKGKQRRGGDRDKHEQDKDGKDARRSNRDKKKGGNKQEGDKNAGQSKRDRGGPRGKRSENLRNIINDDEGHPRQFDARGDRGGRGGPRGRGGRGGRDMPRDGLGPRGMDRDMNQGPMGGRPEPDFRGPREERGPRPYQDGPSSRDDFHVRPRPYRGGERGDRGGERRRGGMMHPDRFGGEGPRGDFYNRPHREPYGYRDYDDYGPHDGRQDYRSRGGYGPPRGGPYGGPPRGGPYESRMNEMREPRDGPRMHRGGQGPRDFPRGPIDDNDDAKLERDSHMDSMRGRGAPMRMRGGPPRDIDGPPRDMDRPSRDMDGPPRERMDLDLGADGPLGDGPEVDEDGRYPIRVSRGSHRARGGRDDYDGDHRPYGMGDRGRGGYEHRGRGGYDHRGRGDFGDHRGRGDFGDHRGRGDFGDYRGRGGYEMRGRGGYDRGYDRGGYDQRGRGDFGDRGRPGYHGDRPERGGYPGERPPYRGGGDHRGAHRGGYDRPDRGGYNDRSDRDHYGDRPDRGGYRNDRDSFGDRGSFGGERGSYRGGDRGFRPDRGSYRGDRGGGERGGRDYNRPDRDDDDGNTHSTGPAMVHKRSRGGDPDRQINNLDTE